MNGALPGGEFPGITSTGSSDDWMRVFRTGGLVQPTTTPTDLTGHVDDFTDHVDTTHGTGPGAGSVAMATSSASLTTISVSDLDQFDSCPALQAGSQLLTHYIYSVERLCGTGCRLSVCLSVCLSSVVCNECIVTKRREIVSMLLLITNRKLHTPFQMR